MTISKLMMAASLLVFVGLAAWGAVALAGHAAPTEVTLPPPTETGLVPVARNEAREESAEAANAKDDVAKILSEPVIPDDLPPVVVDIEPKVGAKDVDPGLKEIRVTFSKKMRDKTWSWTEGNVYAVPKLAGTIHYESGQRTCVMPVKLEPGKTYVLGINSERYRNFKDMEGRPALPYLVVFHTRAAK